MEKIYKSKKETENFPERMCVGCRQKANKNTLIRIVNNSGEITPDLSGKMHGRGAYLHKNAECLKIALKKRGIERNLRYKGGGIPNQVRELLEEITGYG